MQDLDEKKMWKKEWPLYFLKFLLLSIIMLLAFLLIFMIFINASSGWKNEYPGIKTIMYHLKSIPPIDNRDYLDNLLTYAGVFVTAFFSWLVYRVSQNALKLAKQNQAVALKTQIRTIFFEKRRFEECENIFLNVFSELEFPFKNGRLIDSFWEEVQVDNENHDQSLDDGLLEEGMLNRLNITHNSRSGDNRRSIEEMIQKFLGETETITEDITYEKAYTVLRDYAIIDISMGLSREHIGIEKKLIDEFGEYLRIKKDEMDQRKEELNKRAERLERRDEQLKAKVLTNLKLLIEHLEKQQQLVQQYKDTLVDIETSAYLTKDQSCYIRVILKGFQKFKNLYELADQKTTLELYDSYKKQQEEIISIHKELQDSFAESHRWYKKQIKFLQNELTNIDPQMAKIAEELYSGK